MQVERTTNGYLYIRHRESTQVLLLVQQALPRDGPPSHPPLLTFCSIHSDGCKSAHHSVFCGLFVSCFWWWWFCVWREVVLSPVLRLQLRASCTTGRTLTPNFSCLFLFHVWLLSPGHLVLCSKIEHFWLGWGYNVSCECLTNYIGHVLTFPSLSVASCQQERIQGFLGHFPPCHWNDNAILICHSITVRHRADWCVCFCPSRKGRHFLSYVPQWFRWVVSFSLLTSSWGNFHQCLGDRPAYNVFLWSLWLRDQGDIELGIMQSILGHKKSKEQCFLSKGKSYPICFKTEISDHKVYELHFQIYYTAVFFHILLFRKWLIKITFAPRRKIKTSEALREHSGEYSVPCMGNSVTELFRKALDQQVKTKRKPVDLKHCVYWEEG